MKRILTLSTVIIMLVCLCSCGGNGDVRYDSVYDNKTKQYISLGDTKQSVVERIGSGDNDDTEYVEYDDKGNIISGIKLDYNAESKVGEIIYITNTNKSRYSFMNISSEDDFVRLFPNSSGMRAVTYSSGNENLSMNLFKLDEETQEHYINPKNAPKSFIEDIYLEASFGQDKGQSFIRIQISKFSDCHSKHYLKDLKVYEE